MNSSKWSQRTLRQSLGFSLIQTMIAVGLAGMAVTGTFALLRKSSQSIMTSNTSASLESMQNAAHLALRRPEDCKANLINTPLSLANPEGVEVSLRHFDANGNPIGTPIQAGSQTKDLILDSVRLKPDTVLEGQRLLAHILLDGSPNKGAQQGLQMARKIILQAEVDAGNRVTACTIGEVDSLSFDELNQICIVISAGRKNYFPDLGICKDIYEYQWFDGNATQASCDAPGGWTPYDLNISAETCAVQANCTLGVASTKRQYQDGSESDKGPPCGVSELNPNNLSCECQALVGGDRTVVSATAPVCRIRCKRPL